MKRRQPNPLFRAACLLAAAGLALGRPSWAAADTFGSGANSFEIEFVTIGAPGNSADTTGDPNPAGSVPYVYRIGKYEVPEEAVRKANLQSALDGAPLGITLDARGAQKPATSLSWFEAAKFVNFLNTSTGATPAYKFDAAGDFQLWTPSDPGYDPNNLFRNSRARYFLPSSDEWYKAAFYDPATGDYYDYPTGSNTPPIPVESGTGPGTAVYNQAGPADVTLAGGKSFFGTVGQAGNVNEWEESALDLLNTETEERRGVRGRDWSMGLPELTSISLSSSSRNRTFPTSEPNNVGIRVLSIPEPNALWISVFTAPFWISQFRRKRCDSGLGSFWNLS